MTPISQTLPAGFNLVAGGTFTPPAASRLASTSVAVDTFAMAARPITNGQWLQFARGLGDDRFVLLNHNKATGVTEIVRRGPTMSDAAGERVGGPWVHSGRIHQCGANVLLKIIDSPSAANKKIDRSYDNDDEPVMELSHYHALAYCMLKTMESGGKYLYDLPTELQCEFVATERGTIDYGRARPTLFGVTNKKNVRGDGSTHVIIWSDALPAYRLLPVGFQADIPVHLWLREALPLGMMKEEDAWRRRIIHEGVDANGQLDLVEGEKRLRHDNVWPEFNISYGLERSFIFTALQPVIRLAAE